MTFFHINDSIQTPTYQVCTSNEVYIFGMEQGQILIHIDPAYMQKDNGLLVGINERFSHFYIINQERIIVNELTLDWRDCGTSRSIEQMQPKGKDIIDYPVPWFGFGFFILILFALIRRIRCKRY